MTDPLKNYEKYDEILVSKIYLKDACKNAFTLVDTMYKGRRIKEVQVVTEIEHENQVLLGIYIKYYEETNMSIEDELRQELQEAQDALERAQKKLKEFEENSAKNYGWWKPETGAMYYFIDSDGEILHTCFDWGLFHCQDRYNIYNCFKTREEAQLEALKIVIGRKIQDIALRLNKGRKIDWSNRYQTKHFIEITEMDNGTCQVGQRTIVANGRIDKAYCLDKHFADVVEEELEFDLIKYSKLKKQIEK